MEFNILSNDSSLVTRFEDLEESFFTLLRRLEELSSELQEKSLDSKEFADFLADLYYSRDKLRLIQKKTLTRVRNK
jgi:hypothetical protein